MCGILGFTDFSKRLPRSVLPGALESIVHRGPDQKAFFQNGEICLGATRLNILDVENGKQPFTSPDGDIVVVFNGEIFNHRQIRMELLDEGYAFKTDCDTEVIVNAFHRWGRNCFSRFRGMFAIAAWVQSERRLVLARDRMGIKPLYHCLQRGEIFFGSELKCILAHPGVSRHISIPSLDCFLSMNYVPAPSTMIEGIEKLLPGHLLEWQNGRSNVETYVPTSSVLPAPRCLDSAAEELDSLLMESVKEQLVADVPVGVWLSGGLDSSTILSYATAAQSRPIQTFSMTLGGDSSDESSYIKEVSTHFGTRHFQLDLNTATDLCDTIEQIPYYCDEPNADAGALPVWFLSRLTRQHATVALSGEGADELFAGYLTYKADRAAEYARRIPSFVRKAALAGSTLLPVSDERIGFEYKLKRFLQGSLLPLEQAHVFWNGTFSEKQKLELCLYRSEGMRLLTREMKNGSGLQRFLDFDQRYYLPDNILTKVDRMSMAHSVEVRPPFLDPRIVDFAARLPQEFKLRGMKSKYVLRRLMRDKLPPTTLRRRKIGFDIPTHRWFRGALRPLLLDTISKEAVEATGLFNWSAVRALITRHQSRQENVGYHLWGLMILSMWMKRWKIAVPPALEPTPARARVAELVECV